jgi:hypothetical protein
MAAHLSKVDGQGAEGRVLFRLCLSRRSGFLLRVGGQGGRRTLILVAIGLASVRTSSWTSLTEAISAEDPRL